MSTRDIFRDGPSPELQAHWDEMDALEKKFYSSTPEEQKELLEKHPKLRELVTCEACGQTLI
jgi:2-oxo-4-hydroxy-4-carboxy--5-ureidoimidazoline (OHCU) decarboxylase